MGLSGLFCCGGIVAFTVNRGDLAAHGAQVCGKLSAMMNAVVQRKSQIGYRRTLEKTAEIDVLQQLLTRHPADLLRIFGEGVGEPLRDLRPGLHGFRTMIGRKVESPGDNAAVKTMLGCDDVSGELHGGFRVGIGAIIAIGLRDGLDDRSRGAMLVLDCRKRVLKQKKEPVRHLWEAWHHLTGEIEAGKLDAETEER